MRASCSCMAVLLTTTAPASVVEIPTTTGVERSMFVTSDVTPCHSWQRIVWGALYAGAKLALWLADHASWYEWHSIGDYGKNYGTLWLMNKGCPGP